MERKNIAAFTETVDVSYPGYVSINREQSGAYVLTARERGHGGYKVIELEIPEDALMQFAEEIIDRLHGVEG